MRPAVVFGLLLLGGIFIAGCASPLGPATLTARDTPAAVTAGLSQVTYAHVATIGKDWDTVPGNDGVVIYTDLVDKDQRSVLWEGPPLVADVEIWTVQAGTEKLEIDDRLVYRGSANITSWRDGKILMGGGIRVPFSEIIVPDGKKTGRTRVTVHMPDGKTFTGITETTPLVP